MEVCPCFCFSNYHCVRTLYSSNTIPQSLETNKSPFSVDLPFEIYDVCFLFHGIHSLYVLSRLLHIQALKIPPRLDILPRDELKQLNSNQIFELQRAIVKKTLEIKRNFETKYAVWIFSLVHLRSLPPFSENGSKIKCPRHI